MLDLHRNWFKGLEAITAKTFAVLPVTPNQYTAISIVFALICAYQLFVGNYWLALLFFALALGMDFVDGAVARFKNLSTAKGAYLDTIVDRYVEAILLFGLLFTGLPEFYLPGAVWIFLALFGSTMTTYAKAAAKEKGLSEVKGGLMSRAERSILYIAIIILANFSKDSSTILVALLAILSNFTAWQRIFKALRAGK